MKFTHFFLMNALISSLSQTMLLQTPSMLIKPNEEKKSFYDQKKEFGNTEKITLDETEEAHQPAAAKKRFSIKKTSVYTRT